MKNNKNLLRTEDKSRSELRKMFPHDGEEEIEDIEGIKKAHRQEGQSLKNTTTRT
jgi:hypothetical protein